MYKSVWEFVRPTTEVAFPPAAANFNQLRAAASGFVDKEVLFTNSGLTKTVKNVWNSEQDAMNFMEANNEAIVEANTALISYCEANNITITRSIE